MKKLLASLLAICFFFLHGFAQNKYIRPKSLGVSFVMNDFKTAQRIKTGSLETVIREKDWAKLKEMSPGLGLTYFQGLSSHIDFAGSLIASYVATRYCVLINTAASSKKLTFRPAPMGNIAP